MIIYHWKELKYRIYYSLLNYSMIILIIWYYKNNLLFNLIDLNLIYTSLTEAFYTYIYFTILFSFIFSLPFILYQYILFIISGLYEFELIILIQKLSKLLLLLLLFYKLFFNWLLNYIIIFLLEFETKDLILNLKINDFVSFYISFILMFILFVLIGMIKIKLKGKRTLIYMSTMILLGIITPPDVLSLVVTWLILVLVLEIFYFIQQF